jgi:Leucine-rich repeat (LRR) protein
MDVLMWMKRGWTESHVNVAINNLTDDERNDARCLNLRCNKLTSLPNSIAVLVNLEELLVDGNEITELPSSICQLKNLKVLACINNNITSIRVLSSLDSLESLWLANNRLCLFGLAVALKNLRT